MPNIIAKVSTGRSSAPGSVPAGSTNLDTQTPQSGQIDLAFELHMTGTLAQIQADWATLLATSLTCPSAVLSFQS